jgi:DNA polymerase-3 subunit alpha
MGRSEVLATEKEVMGIYLSDHPLRGMERSINQCATHTCASIVDLNESVTVTLAGVIANVKKIVTKSRGEKMAMITLEDFSGQAMVTVFPATFAKIGESLIKDTVVKMTGAIMHRERPGNTEKTVEVRLEEVSPLEPTLDLNGHSHEVERGIAEICIAKATEVQMRELKKLIETNSGEFEVCIQILPRESYLPVYTGKCVEPSPGFITAVKQLFDDAEVVIKSPDASPSDYEEPAYAESA